jgi:trimeric autotransporter adhesin
VAVDAAGDVYVADCCLDPTAIYELAPNGTETVAVNGPGETPLAVDAVGNLFYPVGFGNNTLMELNGAQPPTLKFGPVSVGSTSAPQSIAIQNVGNQTLNAVSTGLSVVGNFLQVPGSGSPADCTSSFSLAPGASCNLSIVFAPKVVGTIHGTATFTDNALNTSPSLSQIVTLKGTGQ